VFELVFFIAYRVERNFKKSSTDFEKKIHKKDEKNFYKLKNWKKKKAKEINYSHEICAKKVHSKMDQQ